MHRLRKHIAIFLVAVLSVVTVPKSLWHVHGDEEKVGTLECEHDSHLDASKEKCFVCQFHAPNFLYQTYQAFTLLRNYFVDRLPDFVDPLVTTHATLPFQRGPPLILF